MGTSVTRTLGRADAMSEEYMALAARMPLPVFKPPVTPVGVSVSREDYCYE
jgi:hypothetical protein